ncbi:MAG: alanyl-tRNA editing protein [Candidatus Diapherotrites archaeon]|nr:alanyl-tRNA editing protein [Candidatus Diapherotrites archaeon]
MTELLYMQDCYAKEFDASVVSFGKGYAVLDRSAFYPGGGGQPSDTGTLNGVGVRETRKKEGEIRHYVEGPLDGGVHGVLDWGPRYAHMRMHTAQHLLSALVLDKYGAETVGNQIHADYSRMDFALASVDDEMRGWLAHEFDKAVGEAREVRIYTTGRDDVIASVDPRRRKLFERVPPFVKEVRVVEIDGIDKCPCAGTHVANTKEIGGITITRAENKGAGKTRLVFELGQGNL